MKSARGIRYLFVLMLLLCGMGSAGARYVQADPIGVDGGWNRFTYALANPLGYADEDGLEPTKPAPYIPMSPTPGAGGKSALPDYSRMTIPPAMRGGVGGGRSSTAGASCLSDAAKGGSAV
ncbi:MAG: hypothetical protein KKC85_07040, partial [Gammaproteobacteria bacterium]|nr:hypothetical protein [Gammaproteobacteria bacterium]